MSHRTCLCLQTARRLIEMQMGAGRPGWSWSHSYTLKLLCHVLRGIWVLLGWGGLLIFEWRIGEVGWRRSWMPWGFGLDSWVGMRFWFEGRDRMLRLGRRLGGSLFRIRCIGLSRHTRLGLWGLILYSQHKFLLIQSQAWTFLTFLYQLKIQISKSPHISTTPYNAWDHALITTIQATPHSHVSDNFTPPTPKSEPTSPKKVTPPPQNSNSPHISPTPQTTPAYAHAHSW